MNLNFKQQLVLALIAGVFAVIVALISKSESSSVTFPPMASYTQPQTNGNTIAISSMGNSTATSTVNTTMIDNRIVATNGGTAININNSSNNNSNININGKNYSD